MKTFIATLVLLAAGMAMGQSMTSSGSGQWNQPTRISNFPDVLVSGGNVNAWHSMPGAANNITSNYGRTIVVASNGGYTYSGSRRNTWDYHSEWGAVAKVEYGNDGHIYGLIGSINSPNSCPGNGVGHDFARFDSPNWTVLTYCFENFQLAADGGSTVLLEDVNGTLWQGDIVNGGWQHVAGAPFPVVDAVLIVSATSSTPLGYYALKTDHTIWQGNGTTVTQMPGAGLALAAVNNNNNADLYVIGTDNNPYHYDYATNNWDRIASNGGLTAIAADPRDVWAIGPLVNNNNIYSLPENGIEWSRTYSGSVTCNVPPPAGSQVCPTFHHTATMQLQTGKKLGPVINATPWNNSGSWNMTAKVHTNDTWDCLLTGAPSDCQVSENNAKMHCSSGANNSDNTLNWIVADSIDVLDYSYNQNVVGPIRVGTATGGYYAGDINNIIHDGCAVNDPVPACPVATGPGNPLDIFLKVEWLGKNLGYDAAAYERWHNQAAIHASGASSPYVSHGFYIGQADANGNLIQGTQQCFGGYLGESDFLYGNIEAAPACK